MMRCRDPHCEPQKGDDGCMAMACNVGAFDALDFVWVKSWDDCPVMAAHEAEAAAEQHEHRQQDEWEAEYLSYLDAQEAAS